MTLQREAEAQTDVTCLDEMKARVPEKATCTAVPGAADKAVFRYQDREVMNFALPFGISDATQIP